jgi:hypothetical protein
VTEDWTSIRDRIARECDPIRSDVCRQVARAMRTCGVPDRTGLAPETSAQRWYARWIAKAADELWYLGLDPEQRKRNVTTHGLAALERSAGAGRKVLLVGTHLGAHTIGLVHLDTLGIPLTILVHEQMLSVMPNYGLQRSTWTTPGRHFSLDLIRATGRIFATYADVAEDGGPVALSGGHLVGEPPVSRLIRAAQPAVFTWAVQPGEDDGVRRLTLTLAEVTGWHGAAAGPSTRAFAEAAIVTRPHDWMLWRRVTTEHAASPIPAWPGSGLPDDRTGPQRSTDGNEHASQHP